MSCLRLLWEVEELGATATLDGDQVVLEAAEGVLDEPTIARLRAARAELRKALQLQPAADRVVAALRLAALTGPELRAATALDDGTLYAALGALYEAKVLRTDGATCRFWLAGQRRPAA